MVRKLIMVIPIVALAIGGSAACASKKYVRTSVGDVNDKIGLDRAEAVKRYLYEQHQIPLFKMNVISYGQDKPVAPNTTKDGRAQNRRVVIRILA